MCTKFRYKIYEEKSYRSDQTVKMVNEYRFFVTDVHIIMSTFNHISFVGTTWIIEVQDGNENEQE